MAKAGNKDAEIAKADIARQRRALLKKLGRFGAVSAPTVMLLLAAKAKPGAAAVSTPTSSRALKTRIGPVNGDAVLAAVRKLTLRAG